MGIHGIYKEIGPGRRVALCKYSAEHYEKHGRPLRLAIDIAIWLFQIQSGKGGTNPALRTFYYRLLRLLVLNIHPVFVFDGKDKPAYKRNKRVGGPNVKVVSIDEFLAKDLLKKFGFPIHLAPGEAEAECALLQREGIVDAVLSEDVDTLMFGSGITMRNWSSETSVKTPTHVNVYNARLIKSESHLDREGMILIAMLSGGDYIPEGVPGFGAKTAYEAAKAGFGAELCKLKRNDDTGFAAWRDRLRHELVTNESKFFSTKKKSRQIPDDFPNRQVLGYYTNPRVSSPARLVEIRASLKWDLPIDFPKLREFTANAFDWTCLGGAKKFIRNLAPAILTRELRLRAEQGANDGGDLTIQASAESRLVKAIHGTRNHASTDHSTEIRVSFVPIEIVSIDLSIEPPDEEDSANMADDDDESDAPLNDLGEPSSQVTAEQTKRGPSKYNPDELEKMWVLDLFLRQGIPLKFQDWETSSNDAKAFLAAKRAAKEAGKKNKTTGGMPVGALDAFTKVTKPGVTHPLLEKTTQPAKTVDTVDLSAMVQSNKVQHSPSPRAKRQQATLTAGFRQPRFTAADLEKFGNPISNKSIAQAAKPTKRTSPEQHHSPRAPPHARSLSATPKAARKIQPTIIDLLSSPQTPRRYDSPVGHKSNKSLDIVSPIGARRDTDDPADLPATVTVRKRSPFKRVETAPAVLASFIPAGIDQVDLSAVPTAKERLLPGVEEVTLLDDDVQPLQPLKQPVFAAFAKRPEKKAPQKVIKKRLQLRESLEGAWKEVDVEMDASPEARRAGSVMSQFTRAGRGAENHTVPSAAEPVKSKEKRSWRKSEVECVDLSGA